MIFIDTGYLWALLDRRDELHLRAVAWHRAVSESLATTEYVLWELINGFSVGENRVKVHAVVDEIRGNSEWKLMAAAPALFEAGLSLHRQFTDKSWSLTDCISFVVMRDLGIRQALAYDQHFEQAGFEALMRRDPP